MVLKQQEEITIYGIAIPADMRGKLENATNGIEALQNANYPEIKLFQISRVMSNQPEEE